MRMSSPVFLFFFYDNILKYKTALHIYICTHSHAPPICLVLWAHLAHDCAAHACRYAVQLVRDERERIHWAYIIQVANLRLCSYSLQATSTLMLMQHFCTHMPAMA